MTARLLSRMHEPLTGPFPLAALGVRATLSPPSPRFRREEPALSERSEPKGAAKRRMTGSRRANLGSTGQLPEAACNDGQPATGNGQLEIRRRRAARQAQRRQVDAAQSHPRPESRHRLAEAA